MSDVTTARKRVACHDPARCGVRWHWSDSAPDCASVPARRGVKELADGLLSRPSLAGIPTAVVGADGGIDMNLTDEAWAEITESSVMVHGLNVNRHALSRVIAAISSPGASSDEFMQDPDAALAFETLYLDPDSRAAVAAAILGPDFGQDAAAVEALSADIDRMLEAARARSGVRDELSLDDLPYLRERVCGLIDACFEAQRLHHAYDAMAKDVGGEIARNHSDRAGTKWAVANGRVTEFVSAKSTPASGSAALLSTKAGAFDAATARKQLPSEVWARAVSSVNLGDVTVSPTEIRRAAKKAGIDMAPYLREATTQVDLMTAPHGTDEESSDSASAKKQGIAAYEAGRNTPGSPFYVPPRTGEDPDRDFATLVRARVRAEMRRSEADAVASTIKTTLRRVEPIAINQVMRYRDSDRDFVFRVNKTTEVDVESFSGQHPEIVASIRRAKRDADSFTPPKGALIDAYAAVLNDEGVSGAADEARARVERIRKPSSLTLTTQIKHGDKLPRPASVGAEAAQEKIARGLALNGRVLTESFE